MRILLTSDTVGGVWSFTRELAAGLLDVDCDISLVSIGSSLKPDQVKWVRAMQVNWGHHFQFSSIDAPLEWMQSNEYSFTRACAPLACIAKEFKADLLHSSQFCFGALLLDIPKVVTAHSDVLSWANACRPAGLPQSDWLSRYRSLVQNGLSSADCVTAPTRWMLNTLQENFNVPCETYVIPNGRSIKQQPTKLRRMQAVTAGRTWDEAKNVAMLNSVSCSVPLIVAGESRYQGAEAPQSACNATSIGRLSEEELLALFQLSEIYICSSRYEPFGLSALEAALCGCAVLANDIPSLREVWQDGALYFDSADSLSKTLSNLDGDRQLLFEAKARSLKQAQRYSRKRMCDAYLSLFDSVIARHSETFHVA